jgi:Nif-specific regulatory protein
VKDPSKFSEIKNFNAEQFNALYQISELLNASYIQDNLVEKALDLVIETLKAERGLFVQYNQDSTFSIVGARNVGQENVENLSEFSSGILQKVITEKEACIYHDVQSDPNLSQFESVQIQKIKSVIGVPILYKGKIWGVILADSQSNRREFTEDNLLFLKFFANLVSLALERILEFEKLQDENLILRNQLDTIQTIPEMIGQSPAMIQLANLIKKVAKTDATVLILGETGTGKDLAAKAIHDLSSRKDQPFLAQFCGSIPDTLLESELFGYKKGAFTGATQDKKGLFEVADNGTFFLDEIADISVALQAKLLRVIQNQEIIRLGDSVVRKVNVRLIAATNKDLKQLVKEGKFREDLFYRLNVFPIITPPLRERKEDITLLADHLLHKHGNSTIHFTPETIKKLEGFSWHGNVRQLENVIQRSIILCEGDTILPEHIILEEADTIEENEELTLKELEKILLIKRLEKYNGNRTLTAKSLGVSVRWIQLKLKEIDD